jgi:hypothetical protein
VAQLGKLTSIIYKNGEIENFSEWYIQLHKTHSGIMGAEWDKEKKLLTVFYEDDATEVTKEALQNLKIPTVLTFRKKATPPKLDSAAVVSATENEFTVETFDTEAVRKEVKEKLIEFEEVKT